MKLSASRYSANFTKFWEIERIVMYRVKLQPGNNGEMHRVLYCCELQNELDLVNKVTRCRPFRLSRPEQCTKSEKRQLEVEKNTTEHPHKAVKVM